MISVPSFFSYRPLACSDFASRQPGSGDHFSDFRYLIPADWAVFAVSGIEGSVWERLPDEPIHQIYPALSPGSPSYRGLGI